MNLSVVFGKQPGFAVDVDVVAVVARGETGNIHGHVARLLHGARKIHRHLDVAGFETRSIGVGDIGGDHFLARCEVAQILAQREASMSDPGIAE